ncbi:MAG: FAD-binding oxidoreductase [Pseudomonadales bacterium]|jgi:FAD/FMN-containing dehydrogenase|nr:FAD-binding oxidoreductase [Pseudomonadales bacterium]MDP6470129.1 FAD-binding oxidoreductase [Pseudomonadales bacterium]MDP6827035.1 FAD-binding oxidoreductase [Pseudomonadales bacterium]MDP6972608.1 FAD-binding oxidoreductase [Pseudomonadales bacterium]
MAEGHSDSDSRSDAVVEALTEALGDDCVMTGDEVNGRAAGIWRSDTIQAKALLRPRTTEQVSRAVRICHRHDQSVVAHGGLTGLVESAVTTPDDIVLSLERMNAIEAINPVDRTAVVQSGVVLQALQEAVEELGMFYPIDLGARGSATIGGNISTNAGGNRVIRYGMTRDMVLGVEAVLADGTVLSSMNHMIKNNAGYDLKHLFIGSEGTLGIVTRAVLRLREKPVQQATMFVAVDAFDKMGDFLKYMDASTGGALSAFEVMWNNFYTLVTTQPAANQPPLPREYPYYVLVEVMGVEEETLEEALAAAFEQELIADAVVARSEAQRLQLWALRDDVEQCFRYAPVFTFDVSLRISFMEEYVTEVNRRLQAEYEEVRNFTLGHMGDGNLHFVVSVGEGGPDHRRRVEACVYEPLAAISGSISAEHGVGLEKKPWLHIARDEGEIGLMRVVKQALDPKGILNPGKVFDMERT